MPETELTPIDPEEEPFVLLVGGNVGPGELGSDDSDSTVHVVVNEILYLPWNKENEMPRSMKLVVPSELAAELGEALVRVAAQVPSASSQAVEFVSSQEGDVDGVS